MFLSQREVAKLIIDFAARLLTSSVRHQRNVPSRRQSAPDHSRESVSGKSDFRMFVESDFPIRTLFVVCNRSGFCFVEHLHMSVPT